MALERPIPGFQTSWGMINLVCPSSVLETGNSASKHYHIDIGRYSYKSFTLP
ncbi:hypothetical protein OE88DRAFT_1658506 [Heliocybe sulcata]|uniref:Uncharacterized protein n=1 Tax=Heliocybe sulcata TaxID=5364 RepID=A0A5C3MTM1_9AGAM|nr:hypothetical protein OE88DRAFT_1664038 [Heliocybe sulcata]TFK51847.1 hypothetical protein OE88DRAFT_1658506 [Heliocybe sulcata]